MWDAASGDLLNTWKFAKAVNNQQVGVVYAGDIIISLSFSGELNYLTLESEKPIRVVTGHQKSITTLTVSDPTSVYTGSYDGKIVNWDIKNGEAKLVEGDGHESLVTAILSTGSNIWSTAWDDTLKSISGLKFTDASSISLGAQPVAASGDGKIIAVVTENSLALYDSENGSSIASTKLSFPAKAVSVNTNAGIVAVARGSDNGVSLYSSQDLSSVSGSELPKLSAAPSYASFHQTVNIWLSVILLEKSFFSTYLTVLSRPVDG